ncbi:unnamed protein product [Rhizophagus irregularis]|uniref:Uncharacterized protein n=1 Tax=Rhizophagus irregularis TaxID=588596 RepID=A0A2I1H2U0_9GLOM|nr:hypothetical protein RhiirA4_471285 [Rhizophagus irregularis]CAB4426282.1 unnamed protein product [Rhizophagus irregularis]CAB4426596.1 unnamed protein product [Rhizophagus irregularis]
MEEQFLKGRSNIALSKNERTKLDEKENGKQDFELVKEYHIKEYGNLQIHNGSPLSTIPRSNEEHEELDYLNNKFSERLEKIEKKQDDTIQEGTSSKEKDKFNENKKRVVAMQGQRNESDSE